MKPAQLLLTIGATLVSLSAHAHTGHDTHSLLAGLSHPFGADHLLAMVAVGAWSVVALPAARSWQGPAAFVLALVMGAVLGWVGLQLPGQEQAIALSVIGCGALLWAVRSRIGASWGLALVAGAGALHGLAHGAEAPATGFGGYALGFVLTTLALHGMGVWVGLALRQRAWVLGSLGALLSLSGVALFAQL